MYTSTAVHSIYIYIFHKSVCEEARESRARYGEGLWRWCQQRRESVDRFCRTLQSLLHFPAEAFHILQ